MQRVWSVYLGNNRAVNSNSNSGNPPQRELERYPEDHRLESTPTERAAGKDKKRHYRYGYQAQRELVPVSIEDEQTAESRYSAVSTLGDNGPSPRTSESTSSHAHSSQPIFHSPPNTTMYHTTGNTNTPRSRPPPSERPLPPFMHHRPGSPGYSAISSREGSPGLNPDESSAKIKFPLSSSSSTNVPTSLIGTTYDGNIHGKLNPDTSNVSLSVNYLPTKFASGMLSGDSFSNPRRRRGGRGRGLDPVVPKMGGGVDAFRSGEARMAGDNDEDEDEYFSGIGGEKGRFGSSMFFSGLLGAKQERRRRGKPKRALRWNRFKWILFFSNTILTSYSLVSLIVCLLTWFDVWTRADIVRVGNRTELIISTLAASMGIFTSLIGWSGILMNNRSFLAIYTFLLWITFIFLVIPGYVTYKKRAFNIEGKINAQWSRGLGAGGRVRIQNQLGCCGYFSPFIEATISQTCYARSILPGCKSRYMAFERMVLKRWYTAVFTLVPVHICIMAIGLLCSNHVTYRFGKGMMPKPYRLSINSMAVIMDNYANQLAERYGVDVASDIVAKSRSQTQLDAMPTMPYLPSSELGGKAEAYSNTKYDNLATSKAPDGAF